MIRLNLDKLLKKENKTVYWLAKETGINWASVNNICENTVASIRLDTLDKICRALNCDVADLFSRTEE